MLWIAWKMLVGNRVKYLGIVFGVVFAAVLIAQQASIFCGLMSLTVSQIRDVEGPGIWVMDRNVQFVDDVKPLSDNDLFRVKGVPGVEWAVRFYKGIARARLERQLWEAFERGGDLEALVEATRQEAAAGDGPAGFRLEVWQQTLVRIRRIEAAMKQTSRPPAAKDL
jgi:putative ABC transport system permease protein